VPWAREQWVEVGERKWNPHEAKLTILEGPKLETQQLSMGRGWRAAQRRSEDITERVLTTVTQAEQERARAQEDARIEEAARAQGAAAAGSEPVAQEGSAVASPAEGPALALAERALASSGADTR